MKIKPSQVKTIQLVCCGQGFNREYQGRYNRYKVLIDSKPIETLFTPEELKGLSFWVNQSRVLAMTIWGSSQEFEARLSIGRFLGWDDPYPKNWGDYCRMLEEIIKAIY